MTSALAKIKQTGSEFVDRENFVAEYYGEKEMRWYQVAARNETIHCLAMGIRRILIELPTGAGKTITIMASLNHPDFKKAIGCTREKVRVLFVAHNHRLLTQAERTFLDDFGVELITQSVFSNIPDEVIKEGWDVTVIDECHHEGAGTYQLKLESITSAPLIGLTATSTRADNVLIKFEHIVSPISREQAVAEGYLSETNLFSVVVPPMKNRIEIVKQLIDVYPQYMQGTLVFMKTKKEVEAVTIYLKDKGYTAIAVIDQKGQALDDVLDRFSRGEVQFLVSCNKLGEGIDVKGCTTVIIGRTLASYPLLNQIIGRAARPDCPCFVFEMINPFSKNNLDATVVTGTPSTHKLVYHRGNSLKEMEFDYTSELAA